MDVIVKLYAELRKAFGCKEMRLPFDRDHVTLGEAMDQLLATGPGGEQPARLILASPIQVPYKVDRNAINPALVLMVNDVDARLTGGLNTPLSDGDVLTLLPTIHGG
nr:MoaD/ThiS family protein [Candidatus Sigynarchaeum springense]